MIKVLIVLIYILTVYSYCASLNQTRWSGKWIVYFPDGLCKCTAPTLSIVEINQNFFQMKINGSKSHCDGEGQCGAGPFNYTMIGSCKDSNLQGHVGSIRLRGTFNATFMKIHGYGHVDTSIIFDQERMRV